MPEESLDSVSELWVTTPTASSTDPGHVVAGGPPRWSLMGGAEDGVGEDAGRAEDQGGDRRRVR